MEIPTEGDIEGELDFEHIVLENEMDSTIAKTHVMVIVANCNESDGRKVSVKGSLGFTSTGTDPKVSSSAKVSATGSVKKFPFASFVASVSSSTTTASPSVSPPGEETENNDLELPAAEATTASAAVVSPSSGDSSLDGSGEEKIAEQTPLFSTSKLIPFGIGSFVLVMITVSLFAVRRASTPKKSQYRAVELSDNLPH